MAAIKDVIDIITDYKNSNYLIDRLNTKITRQKVEKQEKIEEKEEIQEMLVEIRLVNC